MRMLCSQRAGLTGVESHTGDKLKVKTPELIDPLVPHSYISTTMTTVITHTASVV